MHIAAAIVSVLLAAILAAAAAGTVVYFLVAIAAHVRHDDAAKLATPVAIEVLALVALTLQIVS